MSTLNSINMRKNIKNIIILLMAVISSSCSLDISDPITQDDESRLQVIGVVTGFDAKDVSTKSDDAVAVHEMTMFIFGSDEKIVGKPINIEGSMPTFVIDTQNNASTGILGSAGDYNQAEYTKDVSTMSECSIYIVANAWHILKTMEISDLSALHSVILPVYGFGIPQTGIPMIGTHDASVKFDLCDASKNTNTIATIPLVKLYSKVNVNIQVSSIQVEEIPEFRLSNWKLFNIPDRIRLGESEEYTDEFANYLYTDGTDGFTEISGGAQTIYDIGAQAGSYCQFTFYIPEHRARQAYTEGTYTYPKGIEDSEKQRYKPQLLGENKSTIVEFDGVFKDHQGKEKHMTYRIYLGQDSIDDFEIIRNQELNNIVAIKGATKAASFGGVENRDESGNGNISVDYRVESELTGETHFAYYIERETMLDSHIEVRPLLIEFAKGSTGSVKIDLTDRVVEPGSPGQDETWIGIRKDRQEYFTPELTAQASAASLVVPAPAGGAGGLITAWIYFDDNISIYDRDGAFTLTYCSDTEGNNTTSETYTVNVKQYGLIEVQICDYTDKTIDGVKYSVPDPSKHQHYLYIERFEEYLNYYDPLDDPDTEMKYDGLYWATSDETYGSDCYNNYYDGYRFTKEIIVKDHNLTSANIINTNLYTAPKNAAEYCYLKTKRAVNNNINDSNGHWILPGIREMEQILVKWYAEFIEFQNNYYWSSASAKYRQLFWDTESSTNARATKVIPVSTSQGAYFTYAQSGGTDFTYPDGGYADKQELLRIRAAYRKSDGSQITD